MTTATADNSHRKSEPQGPLSSSGLRQEQPITWAATLFGPPLLGLGVLGVVAMLEGVARAGQLLAIAVASFFLLGRFVILGGPAAQQYGLFSTEQLFFLALYLDLLPAALVCFHMDLLFRVPWVGPWMKERAADGQEVMKTHRWLKRAAFVTVVIFVFIPVTATGAIAGSIFGRVLGLTRWSAFLGVALGSLIANSAIYLLAGWLGEVVDWSNPWMLGGSVASVVVVVGVLTFLFKQIRSRAAAGRQSQARA